MVSKERILFFCCCCFLIGKKGIYSDSERSTRHRQSVGHHRSRVLPVFLISGFNLLECLQPHQLSSVVIFFLKTLTSREYLPLSLIQGRRQQMAEGESHGRNFNLSFITFNLVIII